MILDGKKVRDEILSDLRLKIATKNLNITLAILLVGDDEASKIYIKNKEKYCKSVGINVLKYVFNETATEEDVIEVINDLNDSDITGIILQSPVPEGIDFDKCSNLIKPEKDVDGFTAYNIYNLYLGKKTILPCTVKGIIKLLEYYKIPISGSNVVIVGRGNIVGHPLSLALENMDATVTLAHSKTKNLAQITKNADILISATGVKHLITKDMVKYGSTVIDVGVTRVDGKIYGDVDFENIKDISQYITPNPGGVGPMTVAMIIDNLVEMEERKNG